MNIVDGFLLPFLIFLNFLFHLFSSSFPSKMPPSIHHFPYTISQSANLKEKDQLNFNKYELLFVIIIVSKIFKINILKHFQPKKFQLIGKNIHSSPNKMPPNDTKMNAMNVLNGFCPPIYSPLSAAQTGGDGNGRRRRPISLEAATDLKLRNNEQQSGRRFCWSEQRGSQMMNPIREMDEELKRLREAPVQMSKSVGKFQLCIDMAIFRPEDIQLILSPGRLVICAEREVKLDEFTSIGRHFRRQLAIPGDVATDAVATHFSQNGLLTVTMLRRPNAQITRNERCHG